MTLGGGRFFRSYSFLAVFGCSWASCREGCETDNILPYYFASAGTPHALPQILPTQAYHFLLQYFHCYPTIETILRHLFEVRWLMVLIALQVLWVNWQYLISCVFSMLLQWQSSLLKYYYNQNQSVGFIPKICDSRPFLSSLQLQFYYCLQQMASALLTEYQKQYLSTLTHQNPANINVVADVLADLNQQYRDKIQDGSEIICKRTQSLSLLVPHSSTHTKEQLRHYAAQKKQLEMKLKQVYPQITKDKHGRSMVLSDQQRLNFIKKIQAQQEQLQRIKEQQARIRQFKSRQREEEERWEREQTLKQKQQMKRMEVEKRLEELAESREKRQQELRQRNRDYQQVAHQKILLHRIQENYSKQQDINLQQKKKKLAQIRQIHKPMSKQQFQLHLAHINQYRTMHANIRRSEDSSKSLSPNTHMFYKSHWYKEVISHQKVPEDSSKEEKKQFVKELKDRQKKYSEYIKHNFAPDPDEELIQERLKRKAPPIKRKKAKQIRTMGLLNLKACKEMKMSQEQLEAKKKSEENPETPAKKPINYLQQLKSNRRSTSLNPIMFVRATNQAVNDSIKVQSVLNLAEKLEKKAQQREKLQKIKKNALDSEVDELYMGVLNAKLQLLNNK